MLKRNYYSILALPTHESLTGLRAAHRDFVRLLPTYTAARATEVEAALRAFSILLDSFERKKYDEQLDRAADTGVAESQSGTSAEMEALVSILGDRHAVYPCFDEMYDRLLRNFTGRAIPKAEHAEPLTIHVAAPEEVGAAFRLGIPTFPACPVCRGVRQAWPFQCAYCSGAGRVEEVRAMEVRNPSGLPSESQHSLDSFGITNFYLTVRFSR